MVDFFFVLSGFVIYLSYGDLLKQPIDLARFAILRLVRLYPVHFVFLMLFLIVEALKLMAQRHGIHSATATAFQENSLSEFVRHLLLVQGLGIWGAVPGSTFNAPSWSISTEFYAYLTFAVCMSMAGRERFKYVAAGIVLTTCIVLVFAINKPISYFLRCTLGFFTGCLISELYDRFGARLRKPSLVYISIGVIGIFMCIKPDAKLHTATDLMIIPCSAFLVFAALGSRVPVLETVVFKELGRISYSLYMSHLLCIWVMSQVLRFIFKFPYQGNAYCYGYFPALSVKAALIAYPAMLFVCLIVASLTYRFLEAPSHRYVRQLRKRWQTEREGRISLAG